MISNWKDKNIEVALGNLLRWGVILSSIVVIAGGIIYLFHHGSTSPDYTTFHGLLLPFHSMSEVWNGVMELRGEAIIQLGVILLIATPIARVAFSVVGFIWEKDLLYIFLTLLVLGIILTSMFLGVKG
ncbi:MAG: DUF1634 domain-containing protein [Chitinophagales bacterium]|nr:DUF1634 domain-containing protein [Chitinophagales bacterium]